MKKITIKPQPPGWLATCRCGWETYTLRHPVIVRTASAHANRCKEEE